MSIHKLNNIKDTTLWQILDSKFKNTAHEELASRLSANIVEICREAADKMKALPAIMPQYTLHDQVHLLRVTELMAMVGDSVCEKLNPAELALAILSANFHDHGMVLDGKEVAELNRDPAFRLFAENWKISNPSLREIERELTGSHSNEATKHVLSAKREELLRGMITDFVRQRHAAKSREYVNSSYSNDRRWEIHGVNFSRHVGVLCESHGRDAEWLNAANDCHYDWSIATLRVNVQYIGVLLRLADILDFDKDRTPDFLYRSIHFTNSVSLREWEKHRSIQGWVITPNLVRFTAECNHPVYERAVRQYMDWIDTELANSHALVRKFPTGIAEHYQLKVPMRVDRSHIKALNDCYRYHDLEFTLSRDELVELLMTTNLYKDPSLCVRELLQNALDALRHRQAIYRMNNQFAPEGSVELIHNIDSSGYEVLQCKDTGVGMDESIIEKFLTRVGRSYYRSPEFEQVRTSFQARGVDFDPCSRFGIGFMSCFMLGDRIRIHTRRDYGPGMAWGDPLVVEISGLGGLVVIRKGAPSQEIGTTVELTSRKKPTFFDMWEDQIRLIPVVREYARASEFTIRAKTTIDEIAGSIEVTPGPKRPKHPLQKSPIKKFTVIEQHFSEVDSRLDGSVVLALLIDGQGNPTFKMQEAKMAIINEHTHRQICYVEADGQKQVWKHKYQEGATCMDGILVSGGIERCEDEESMLLARYSNIIRLPENFILDIRGDIKPELTPARRPPDSADRSPRWSFIQKLAWEAHGKLWGKVADFLKRGMSSKTFWALAGIYHPSVAWVPPGILWNALKIPVFDFNRQVDWLSMSELGELTWERDFILKLKDGRTVGIVDSVTDFPELAVDDWDWLNQCIADLVIRFSALTMRDNRFILTPREQERPEIPLPRHEISGSRYAAPPIPLIYTGELSKCLAAETPKNTVNRNHEVCAVLLTGELETTGKEFRAFGRSIVSWFADSSVLATIGGHPPCMLSARGLSWLGKSYESVDWNTIEAKLAPPYSFYTLGAGIVSLKVNHLVEWAKIRITHANVDSDAEVQIRPA